MRFMGKIGYRMSVVLLVLGLLATARAFPAATGLASKSDQDCAPSSSSTVQCQGRGESRRAEGVGRATSNATASIAASISTDDFILVSMSGSGEAGYGNSYTPSISADGRYIAFTSIASNLVAGDSNGISDVFVRDPEAGTTNRISVDSSGVEGNGSSQYEPAISADGRYVAFQSDASNLVAGDTNDESDIFVHDTMAHTTVRVSVDGDGAQGNGSSTFPAISANGRYVAFVSGASNLVVGDSNGANDIFVHDTFAGATIRVSVNGSGTQGDGSSHDLAISADGRYVAFQSNASNLVAGDSNGHHDIFVRDIMVGSTTRVTVNNIGVEANSSSADPTISADGRYVAFYSAANNLVAGDANGKSDIFLHDTMAHTTILVSVDSSGVQGNSHSYRPTISFDGHYVAFQSDASNLVVGDSFSTDDIFIRDIVAGTTFWVTEAATWPWGNRDSFTPTLSSNGRYLAFISNASNLVTADTNGVTDVFRTHIVLPPSTTVPTTPLAISPGIPIAPGPVLDSNSIPLIWISPPETAYNELVFRDVASGVQVVNTATNLSTFTANLAPGRAYKWNLAACNALGCSAYTQALFFQTPTGVANGPAAPVPLSPGNASYAVSVTGSQATLTWTAVSGAAAYSVGLRDVTTDVLATIPLVVGSTSQTVNLTAGHEYRWDVASCITASGDTVSNCPNRSGDMRFLQGNSTAYLEVEAPEPVAEPPQLPPTVDSLVLVAHGWNSSASAWPDALVDKICNELGTKYGLPVSIETLEGGGHQCTVGRWRVLSHDWQEQACNDPGGLPDCLPDTAVNNAGTEGVALGDAYRENHAYRTIHLIAHSAGSRLIQRFAERYNCVSGENNCKVPATGHERATIHMTFLDAFCPNVNSCNYGKNADWAEQYVDSRHVIFEGDLTPSLNPSVDLVTNETNVTLPNAVNFDVTALDRNTAYSVTDTLSGTAFHAFPYRQYSNSAGINLAPAEFTATSIACFHRGAELAAWNQGNAASPGFDPAAHIVSLRQKGVSGRATLVPPIDATSCLPPAPNLQSSFSAYLNAGFSYSPVSSACTANSTPSMINVGTCLLAPRTNDSSPSSVTPDPGVVLLSVMLGDVADRVGFDYQFSSATSAGSMQVFVDNLLVHNVAVGDDAGVLQRTGPIEIPRLDAGAHELRIVVKSGTTAPASVTLSNLVFDRVALRTPDAPHMNVATAGNGQATVVFSEPAFNGGAPITGFTVTSHPAGGVDSHAGTLGEGHVITGLTNGVSYTFTVTATNSQGTGAASSHSNPVTPFDPSLPRLTVADISIIEGNSGASAATFTATLSAPAPTGGVGFVVSTISAPSPGRAALAGQDYSAVSASGHAIPAGQTTATFTVKVLGDTVVEPDEVFSILVSNVSNATAIKGRALATILNDDAVTLASVDPAGQPAGQSPSEASTPVGLTAISAIQGSGLVSPMQGSMVRTQGIVTALHRNGFFLQSARTDANVLTSEGIYVQATELAGPRPRRGDLVEVHGRVQEARGDDTVNARSLTQLVARQVQVLASMQGLPTPIILDARNLNAGQAPAWLERYEGMRIAVPSLTVVAPSGWARSHVTGQVAEGVFHGVATGVPRPFREPGMETLDPALTTLTHQAGARPVIFDGNPERLRIESSGQSNATAISADAGDVITGLVGVLSDSHDTYALLPDHDAGMHVISGASPRAVAVAMPEETTIGRLDVADLVVAADGDRQNRNDKPLTATALKLAKIANAICAYAGNPDILSVADAGSLNMLSDIATATNERTGDVLFSGACSGKPEYRVHAPKIGNGARIGGFLVSTAEVRPGLPRVQVLSMQTHEAGARFLNPDGSSESLHELPPQILRVRIHQENGHAEPLTVIAYTMLAKDDHNNEGTPLRGWASASDRVRAKRRAQALELARLLQSRQVANPRERVVVLGGFDSSEFSDGRDDVMGIVTGRTANTDGVLDFVASPVSPPLVNMTLGMPAGERYTITRAGNAEAVDHILVNRALLDSGFGLRTDYARINADFGDDNADDYAVPMRVSDRDVMVLYLNEP